MMNKKEVFINRIIDGCLSKNESIILRYLMLDGEAL